MQNMKFLDNSMFLLIFANFFGKPFFLANLNWPINELCNMYYFAIFIFKTTVSCTPAGIGLNLPPPPQILVFKYPSRCRVNISKSVKMKKANIWFQFFSS